ncbi:MAG: ATP-dependent Clp protease proteolytic subunit [Bacteroidaceae bacterium]|nr:ATP-dependent Clp protease proteolytic subunit [Bacteroidaceae bacterium]
MPSILSEYVASGMSILDLKKELSRLRIEYNKLTGRNLFIFASDFTKGKQGVDVTLNQDDFYMIQDILRESKRKQIDIYLETPGGSGEAAEEIARFLHTKFEEVNFVIAGEAKSAGTILVMCADNIYMCSTGSLGPIDAQVQIGRKMVSAYDYTTWVKERRDEAIINGKLNPFDAIMVAQISPGELYGVENSLQFAKDLVKGWLPKYKFKNWNVTQTRHLPVTPEMKAQRASEISDKLCNHMDWHSHGRSLKIEDLSKELLIEDIDNNPSLADVVYRIKTVIRLIFESSTDYKIYNWEDCELSRTANVTHMPFQPPRPKNTPKNVNTIDFSIVCPKCKKAHLVRGYLDINSNDIKNLKLPTHPLVKDGEILACDSIGCGFNIDLKPIKNTIENQLKRKITIR